MEFWGVEVPSGKPLSCKPGADSYVHVSQAALGDNKFVKGNDRVVLKVKVGSTEVVVGTLSQGKCDQTTLDLIFEKDFVLSHNGSGSVFFCGYKTDAVRDDVSGSSDEDDELDGDEFEEDTPELLESAAKENGRSGLKAGKVEALVSKPAAKASPVLKVEVPAVDVKPKAKSVNVAELPKVNAEKSEDEDEDEEDDDEDDDDEDDDEDEDIPSYGGDEDDVGSDEDDSDDSDDSDESEEEQPKSAGGKKRSLPMAKSGVLAKKNKVSTPGKLEPKLLSTPASTLKQQQSAKKDVSAKKIAGKENAATPASGKKLGQHFCEPCKKNFNSDSALSQHKLAKHK